MPTGWIGPRQAGTPIRTPKGWIGQGQAHRHTDRAVIATLLGEAALIRLQVARTRMTRRAWILFAAMSALWGLPYLLIKVAVAEVDPMLVVFVRLALAAVVLLPIAAATGSLARARRHWRRLLLTSSAGIALPFLLIAYGEQHITSSLAALLIAADPLFVVLLALPFDASERASGARLLGLLVRLGGVAVRLGLNV